jgi:23S rRNA (cytosine1962-C5)-methyltransferase
VRVQDESGRFIGAALWSPTSQISLRMLTREDRAIDADFWRERVAAAVAYRESLGIEASAYRVVHGEADGMPSLVVDRYGDYLVTQYRRRTPGSARAQRAARPQRSCGACAREPQPKCRVVAW